MHIVVSDFGISLGKKSERLLLRQKGAVIGEAPFRDIEQITIVSKGVSLSTDVIRECVEYGIQINFLSFSGKPYAKLSSPNLTGTVITRREQILAYADHRGVELAKAFVEGKIKNQANILKYFAKYRRAKNPETYQDISRLVGEIDRVRSQLSSLDAPRIEEIRGQLLAVEGRAAQHYWDGLKILVADHIDFEGRERRGALDPFNSTLNYGYGILYNQIWGAINLAGLDAFAGYLHSDRPGKPSLVLDLVEEFRPIIVDRVVVAMTNKGIALEVDDNGLSQETRREIAKRVMERLNAEESYNGKKYKLQAVIQMQARRIASFLRGETKYKPFVGGW
ncbi:MAG: CRISPR-associated endonuclease Cas1 [Peptococcaceae bacterium]|nr:CRISPR-associated endonuclease Cas1 [Peptococcaceae bacterium]